MRYVIWRDDDVNALTPVECLDRLYAPFLQKGLPVNLAVIPDVRRNAVTPAGAREGFLPPRGASDSETVPLGRNRGLIEYLTAAPGYHLAQHGCHHDCFEFDRRDGAEIRARLERGWRVFAEAGLPRPRTFVAPHDRLSRRSLTEVAGRFEILSTGWFELRRLPFSWWPSYLIRKARRRSHWRVGQTLLLTHPGCLLSCQRPYPAMLQEVRRCVESRSLTVLVTHWWEYFRAGKPDEEFIAVLHSVGAYLASDPEVKVISFDALAEASARRKDRADCPGGLSYVLP